MTAPSRRGRLRFQSLGRIVRRQNRRYGKYTNHSCRISANGHVHFRPVRRLLPEGIPALPLGTINRATTIWRRPLRWGWAFRFAFPGSAVLARTAANARTTAASSQLGSGGRLISGHPLGPPGKVREDDPGMDVLCRPGGAKWGGLHPSTVRLPTPACFSLKVGEHVVGSGTNR